jgi:hypothetical protein
MLPKRQASSDHRRDESGEKGATGVRLLSWAPNACHRETAVELVCDWGASVKCQLQVDGSHDCGSEISITSPWEIAMDFWVNGWRSMRKQAFGGPCHRRNEVALRTSHISGSRVQTTTGWCDGAT